MISFPGDLWPEEDREGEEPEWVKTERVQFTDYRDKNKDGRMDKSEVADWILPPDYDHITSEVKHLVAEADENKVRSHQLLLNFILPNFTSQRVYTVQWLD